MRDATDKIKPEVRALRAYALSPDRARVKINQNENPWEAPARIKAETLRRLQMVALSGFHAVEFAYRPGGIFRLATERHYRRKWIE